MKRADVASKLKASESPMVWWLVAVGCHAIRPISPNSRRWSSRLGYALERLDQAREAKLARAEAALEPMPPSAWLGVMWRRGGGSGPRAAWLARRLERAGDWAAAATAYREAVQHDPTRAVWWCRLGWCLRQGGDLAGAVSAVRAACARDGSHPRWFSLLGQIEEESGDLRAAEAAHQRAVELGGAQDPRWRLRLAALHDRVGQWDEAQRVLRDNVALHPRHALSYRRLGEVSLNRSRWAGTFTGTLAGRGAGRFRFDPDPAEHAAVARRALERSAQLEPAKTAWRAALADARLADGDPQGAIELYEAALRDAEQSTGRWVLGVRHRWRFHLESIYHQLGRARVEDPLFECAVRAPAPQPPPSPDQVVGLFDARTTFAGLAITGFLATDDGDQVEIRLGGEPLRAVKLSQDGFFRQFSLEVKRATLCSFPRHGVIEVRSASGVRLHAPGGAERLEVAVPHGNGRLRDIMAAGGRLDKKGAISPSPEETRLRQQRYLEIYLQVRDFFEKELGRSLFLMYGTLLGYHRDGDFIPGDDDFDAGYVSDQTDPVAVKEETKGIIIELIRAGFTVSFNRKGRLFRLQLEREANDRFHLDLRPVWFQDGKVWVHNHASFPSRRDQFLPAGEGELRGVRVSVPREPEAFLRGHYGPGWAVPDPGFMYYPSEVDPSVHANLAEALITVREYRELAERLRREVGGAPDAGRLVSVGSQDLYPLDEFLA
jgi:tetratricopeptide (TPR) repeat protein